MATHQLLIDPEPAVTGWRRIPATYRVGGLIVLIAVVMASLFALSYGLALGRPSPRDVAIGTVGAQSSTVVRALEKGAKGGLDVHPYGSLAAAENAVEHQRVYAIIDGRTSHPRLLLSGASGASVSRVLQQIVQKLPPNQQVQISDLHPLPRSDPQGLVTFYVTIAATILGFVTTFQLRANLSAVGMRAWSTLVAALAVVGGLSLTVLADVVLHALQGPFLEIWVVLAAQIAVAALFNSTMLLLVGRWSIIVTWGVFILLGNSSSGGSVAPPLLPPVFAFLNRYLPSGATVSALHSAVYFRNHQRAEPLVVLAVWLLATVAGLVVLGRVRGRSPAD